MPARPVPADRRPRHRSPRQRPPPSPKHSPTTVYPQPTTSAAASASPSSSTNPRPSRTRRPPSPSPSPSAAERRVYQALTGQGRTVNELAEQLGLTGPNLRKTLRNLRGRGLVAQHGGSGRTTTYQRTNP
ncbi:winged helix-turn-helix domain-containing protein [Frankia tisae]|uniref:winged helix-turn-helix domain-containing protein n=1 Tax=Frankia tisae TaxID=2950104 RepID=UPI0027E32741|nr:winged helix-turn-helix domain-containing protein [Frankia tisae]